MLGILILGLFLYRKPFSYLSLGGIYIIELFTALMMVIVIVRINRLILRKDLLLILMASGFFVLYGILMSLRTSFSPKLIIVYLYYSHLIIFVLYVSLLRPTYRIWLLRNIYLLFTNPLLWIVLTLILEPILGKAIAPGQTLVYGVGLAYAFYYNGNRLYKLYYLVSALGASLILMERASFLNGVLIFLFFSLLEGSLNIKKVLIFSLRLVVGLIGFILFAPVIVNLFFPDVFTRFELNSTNLLNFFMSIFGGDFSVKGSDMHGTRSHRLMMWMELLKFIHSDWRYWLFGFGFEKEIGEYIGIEFRAPHNGYLTLLFRLGYIGLTLFFTIVAMMLSKLKSVAREHPIYLMVLLGFLMDALTGTAFDSPFTLGLVFSIISIGLVYHVELVDNS